MRRTARLVVLYTLEAIAALLALAVCIAGAGLWRLAGGPVDAEMIRPAATEALIEAVGGDAAAIGRLQLSFDPALAALVVTARDVTVARAGGEVIVAAERVETALALDLLLAGRAAPVRISAEGGAFSLWRDAEGRWSAGLGGLDSARNRTPAAAGAAAGAGGAFSADLRERTGVLSRLLTIDLQKVDLQIRDDVTDWTVLVRDARALLDFSGDQLDAEIAGDLLTSAGLAPVSLEVETGRDLETVFIDAHIAGLVPATAAPRRGPFAALVGVDAPLDLEFFVDASRTEGLRAVLARVDAGAGAVRLDGRSLDLREARFEVALDAEQGTIEIPVGRFDSDLASVEFTGSIFDIAGFDDALPSRARYALDVEAGRLDPPGVFSDPLVWDQIEVRGVLDRGALEIRFDQLNIALPALTAPLSGALRVVETSAGWLPSLRLQGPLEGEIGKQDVLRHWPVDFALGARDWVRDSIIDGRLFDAQLDLNIPAEAIAARDLRNEHLSLRFGFRDADVRYFATMTPLLGLSGEAELRGNSLSLNGVAARIGEIEVDTIFVEIPRLNPKGALARFGGTGRGAVRDLLALVDEPPLEIPQTYGFRPEDFGGVGDVSFEIQRPMRRTVPAENLGFLVTGQFTDVSAPTGAAGVSLENGVVDLEVSPDGMRAEAEADLASARAQVTWIETFGLEEGAATSRVEASAMLTGRDLDRLGLPLRRFMDGGVAVEAVISGRGFDFGAVDLELDLTDAAVALPADLWEKPAGEPAEARFTLTSESDGAVSLDAFSMAGRGLELDARARLAGDGRLLAADAERVFIDGRLDVSAAADRPEGPDGPLRLLVSGPFLDARDLFGIAAPGDGGAFAAPLIFEGALDVALVRRSRFTNVDLTFAMGERGVDLFRLAADAPNGPIEVQFAPEEPGAPRRLYASGPGAGVLLAAFTGYDNVSGGDITLVGEAPPVGEAGGVVGELVVSDFTLDRMPLLARILTLGSLEGLAGLLSGEGIPFEELRSAFVWENGVLEMRDSRVAGPSLGATWSGVVDFGEARADVDGTLLPSYAVNSILGSVPVLGELFTSREGEGVIGVTFSASGPFDEMRVLANPLSALAPGVLRRIFEGTSAERELEALEAQRRERDAGAAGPGEAEPAADGAEAEAGR